MSSTSASTARLHAVRLASKLICKTAQSKVGSHIVTNCSKAPALGALLNYAVGYRTLFPSMREASESALRFLPVSHELEENINAHLALADSLRPSDYPMLFHLSRALSGGTTVFDLGGNAGNLFYSYDRHLHFTPALRWKVYDLPATIEAGKAVAQSRNEGRLRFTSRLEDAADADIFIASGSLHYFESSPAELLQEIGAKPRHVLLNRTPFSNADTAYTVQDAGTFLVPCKLFNKNTVIAALEDLGYELIDSWQVHELRLHVPLWPEGSPDKYSGLYLRLKDEVSGRSSADYQGNIVHPSPPPSEQLSLIPPLQTE